MDCSAADPKLKRSAVQWTKKKKKHIAKKRTHMYVEKRIAGKMLCCAMNQKKKTQCSATYPKKKTHCNETNKKEKGTAVRRTKRKNALQCDKPKEKKRKR
jgi:hypothetical protein